jgi:hypothetical protein
MEEGRAHLGVPMAPSVRCTGVWPWQDGKKICCGFAQKKVRDRISNERYPGIRMNRKAEIVVIPMMLQAQQHPIFQGVNSPEILLCPRALPNGLSALAGSVKGSLTTAENPLVSHLIMTG